MPYYSCYVILILLFAAPAISGEEQQERHINIEAGKASLAFVFDTTGSMKDDLEEAKYGASEILDTTLSLPNKPLHNFILVPFNDPDEGDVFETTDPDAFQRELDKITVDGGGDCPELCIGAIYKAIDACLPHSYIYVFTDASAKDYNLKDSVKALNQQKQSQVVFLLSGYCGDASNRGRKVYDEIADSSSGRVFLINKAQVEEVLKILREDIRNDRVNLMFVSSTEKSSTFSLPIDSNLEEITISANGKSPSILLTDSLGNNVRDIEILLDVENALVVEANQPKAGNMTVDVNCEGPHTVRVTGKSSANYSIGISPKHSLYVNGTEYGQLTGYSTFMYITAFVNGTRVHPTVELSRIELLKVDGTFITSYDLTRNKTDSQIYETPLFEPPAGYFYVKVKGTDENGYEINRLMSAAITGLQPQKPKLAMPDVVSGCKGSQTIISCDVESLVPFSVRWYRQDEQPRLVGEEKYYLKTAKSTLDIPDVCKSDGGFYICNATNSAGSVAVSTYLNVTSCMFGLGTCAPCPKRTVCKTCNSSCPPPIKMCSNPPPIQPCSCPSTIKSCSNLPQVEPKCNRTTDSGTNLRQTDTYTSYLQYGIASLIGAGIVLVLEMSVIIVCKLTRKSKKTTAKQPHKVYRIRRRSSDLTSSNLTMLW